MRNGYMGVKIAGKGTTVHAAVALAFHGLPPTPAHTVNHKNGVKTDNAPGNLEWLTRKQNMRHAVEILGVKFGGKPRLPPVPTGPEPLTLWQRIVVEVYVPTSGRCDQHAAVIDGERVGLLWGQPWGSMAMIGGGWGRTPEGFYGCTAGYGGA